MVERRVGPMDSHAHRTSWTFLTNHARVLSVIARDPDVRLRDVALTCRLTERAVQAIVSDLETAGYLTHEREGRRNRYQVTPDTRLRHPAEANSTIEALLRVWDQEPRPAPTDAHSPV